MNELIKACIKSLPISSTILKSRYNKRFLNNKYEQLYRGKFNSWVEANDSAPSNHTGYDIESTVDMYDSLINHIDIHDYPVMFWLNKLDRPVFDYGGHVGIKFYAYFNKINISYWTVCDVPCVVKRGRELADKVDASHGLTFTCDFNEVDSSDVLLCSGSLQYIEEPLSLKLSKLQRMPKRIILNTTAFTRNNEPEWFTLNSIGKAFCPYKIQNEQSFSLDMEKLGYKLIASWENPNRASEVPYLKEPGKFKYCGSVWGLL